MKLRGFIKLKDGKQFIVENRKYDEINEHILGDDYMVWQSINPCDDFSSFWESVGSSAMKVAISVCEYIINKSVMKDWELRCDLFESGNTNMLSPYVFIEDTKDVTIAIMVEYLYAIGDLSEVESVVVHRLKKGRSFSIIPRPDPKKEECTPEEKEECTPEEKEECTPEEKEEWTPEEKEEWTPEEKEVIRRYLNSLTENLFPRDGV